MHKEFSKSLAPWFGKTVKMIDNKLEEKLDEKNIDISKMQFLVLKNVQKNDGICQQDLAFFTNRNKSSLTRMINTLEKKNYIAREASNVDKRKNKIVLTNLGKKVLQDAMPIFLEMAADIEQGLTAKEIESTINLLKKIQQNINGSVSEPEL